MPHLPSPDTSPSPEVVRFGPFELDLRRGRLSRDAVPVVVAPRPFALLCHLARHAGRVVPKDELIDAVWGHEFLSESALKATVNNLRRALGEDGSAARWIVTSSRRGYCLEADAPDAAAPAPGTPARAAVIAIDPGLVGRAAELRALHDALGRARVVTLLGSAGIGKTRLAQAALPALQAAFEDGAALVPLQALRGEADVIAEIAQACGLPASAGRDARALATALSRRRQAVVLDNCEHLLPALGALVARLVAQAPPLRVLATSQAALGVPGEHVLTLEPLPVPPAGAARLEDHPASALLLQRLRAIGGPGGFTPAQREQLGALCRAVDGVPLQLELAASRVRMLGVEAVHAHLDERLSMLRAEAPGTDARHRSLRASIAWSCDLLDARQRRVLRRLAVFEASFATDLAQRLLARTDDLAPWDAVDALEQLAGRSLLTSVADDDAGELVGGDDGAGREGGGPPRWRLLQSLRLFAADELERAGDAERTRDAHAQVMLERLRERYASSHDVPVRAWAGALRPELHDVRAALRHDLGRRSPRAWALWAAAMPGWLRNGVQHEPLRQQQALEQALPPPRDPEVRADVALAVALMCLYNLPVDLARGSAAADEAVELNRALGRPLHHYHALYVQGQLLLRRGRSLHEHGTLQAMQALERPDWPALRLRHRRLLHGYALAQAGDVEAFRRSAADELERAVAHGPRDEVWTRQHLLAQATFACGDVAGAGALLERTWREIERAGQAHLHWSTEALNAVLLAARDVDGAASPAVRRAVLRLWRHQQLHLVAAALPWLCAWTQRWHDAARLLGFGRALLRGRGERAGPIAAWAEQAVDRELARHLPDAALQAAARDGEQLDEWSAIRLALPDLAQRPEPPAPPAHPPDAGVAPTP